MTYDQRILIISREYFSILLKSSKYGTPGFGESKTPSDKEGKDVLLADYDEVRAAIVRGLLTELFKYDGDELMGYMHQALCKIWSDESILDDWSLSVLQRKRE